MKHTASKIFRTLCGIAVMLAVAAGIASVPVSAAGNGIYTATATPHYRHPTTGKIEDSGGDGSAVLGQSMTESATYKKALVEVDSEGNTYITVRLKLMDNIQNPEFQVDGKPVYASLMQEDYSNNTADYRMKVNSEKSVIRCNMYVVPMGREVIFYITVSDLQSGSEDFIASLKVDKQTSEKPEISRQTAETEPSEKPDSTTEKEPASVTPTEVSSPETTEPETTEPSDTEKKETETSETVEKDGAVLGLQEFDGNGNKVSQNSEETTETSQKSENGSFVWLVFCGVAVIAAAGGCVWYFCFFKKKK